MAVLGIDKTPPWNICDKDLVEKHKLDSLLHKAVANGKATGTAYSEISKKHGGHQHSVKICRICLICIIEFIELFDKNELIKIKDKNKLIKTIGKNKFIKIN